MTAPLDTSKVLLLNELATALHDAESNQALTYAEEALVLAENLHYKRGLGKVKTNIGWMCYRLGKYSKALAMSVDALKINQEVGDKQDEGRCFITIGAINAEEKLYNASIANLKKAYKLGVEAGVHSIKIRSLNNIAYVNLKMNQLDSARHYALRALDENVEEPIRAIFSNGIIGEVLLQQGNTTAALGKFKECLKFASAESVNFLVVSSLVRLGKTHIKLEEPDHAIEYLTQSISIAEKFKLKNELKDSFKFLAEAYSLKNDFQKAFDYQSKFHSLNDSLIEQKTGEQIELARTQLESDFKNSQIELLTKNGVIKEHELSLQRTWIFFGIVGLLALSVLVFILTWSNSRSKKINSVLAEKNMLINEQTEQLVALNETKDKLLSILGHDLRTPMNGLRGLMDLLQKSFLTQEEFVSISKKIKTNVDYVYEDLDSVLKWAQAQQKGLKAHIEEIRLYDVIMHKVGLLAEISSAKKITTIVEVEPNTMVHADRNQLGLIIRNLINNAIKFSFENGKIVIAATTKNGQVEISVIDQGVGIENSDAERLFRTGVHFSKLGTNNEKGTGLGLLLVKEFVELNRGTIRVTSKVGEGSTFTFSLPATA